MSALVFLNDGQGSIYDKSGAEAMDRVDEQSNLYASKQPVNLDTYMKRTDVTVMSVNKNQLKSDVSEGMDAVMLNRQGKRKEQNIKSILPDRKHLFFYCKT
ncbi:hypothetical protein BD560DRAFT_406349 [Blakeslea trispora]|nr:hypothetical protein BD560DRAFT_406349 [Blakeslea trispora]